MFLACCLIIDWYFVLLAVISQLVRQWRWLSAILVPFQPSLSRQPSSQSGDSMTSGDQGLTNHSAVLNFQYNSTNTAVLASKKKTLPNKPFLCQTQWFTDQQNSQLVLSTTWQHPSIFIYTTQNFLSIILSKRKSINYTTNSIQFLTQSQHEGQGLQDWKKNFDNSD